MRRTTAALLLLAMAMTGCGDDKKPTAQPSGATSSVPAPVLTTAAPPAASGKACEVVTPAKLAKILPGTYTATEVGTTASPSCKLSADGITVTTVFTAGGADGFDAAVTEAEKLVDGTLRTYRGVGSKARYGAGGKIKVMVAVFGKHLASVTIDAASLGESKAQDAMIRLFKLMVA